MAEAWNRRENPTRGVRIMIVLRVISHGALMLLLDLSYFYNPQVPMLELSEPGSQVSRDPGI